MRDRLFHMVQYAILVVRCLASYGAVVFSSLHCLTSIWRKCTPVLQNSNSKFMTECILVMKSSVRPNWVCFAPRLLIGLCDYVIR